MLLSLDVAIKGAAIPAWLVDFNEYVLLIAAMLIIPVIKGDVSSVWLVD